MAQLLDPWIPNAMDAKGPVSPLGANAMDAKGPVSPFGAGWQPPERFGVAKGANEPFWCPIKKKPLFSMAQWLDPWILNAKGAKAAKGALSPCGAWWQPPRTISGCETPQRALLVPYKEKTFVFDGAVARSLDPQC